MTADLARLGRVLGLERREGCRDTAVQGGLDELLRRQARDEPPGSPLLRMVGALPPAGYRSLPPEERRGWLGRAIATVEHELRSGSGKAAPRRRPARSPRPSQSGAAASKGGAPSAAARREAAPPPPRAPRSRAASPPRAIPEGAAALGLPIAEAGARLGQARQRALERLGVRTVGDALRHWPHRHDDYSRVVPIAELILGEKQTVRATVEDARERRWGRKGAEATIADASGARMKVVWWNQPFVAKQLRRGMEIALAGEVDAYRGRPTFNNPAWEEIGGKRRHTGRFVPVYPATEGLPQQWLRETIANLLDRFADRLPETLPDALRERRDLPPVAEAVRAMHYPGGEAQLAAARRRLAFDELLALQIGAVRRKRERLGRPAPAFEGEAVAGAFLGMLPFAPTAAQRRALGEVLGDLARPRPMARLLQGDVGSGKTVVALAAMLAAAAGGSQAALMAPTEVLAEQHFRTVCRLLSGEPEPPLHGAVPLPFLPEPLRVVLLTGSTRAKERRAALEAIGHGGPVIAVGTHALIQEGVEFARLGLAVADEQHRFGVRQRSALLGGGDEDGGEGPVPHLLVMTATPIPRSLALTLYGDLDLSAIDELPPGRTPIGTIAVPQPPYGDLVAEGEYEAGRAEAFARIRSEVAAGRQAFVICPLVEGSDAVAARAATEEYERVRDEELPGLGDRVALLHGRMSARAKDEAMRRFAAGETAVLVATAVVEVGIDVPNATVMLIEGANRFGLAQLHQFRGRVGRGGHASVCYLLGDDPRPPEPPPADETGEQRKQREQREQQAEERREAAAQRLELVAASGDGFALAQADLELRGSGDLFGTRQAGASSLRLFSLREHASLIEATRREAETLLGADPALAEPRHAALRAAAERAEAGLVAEAH